MGKLSFFTLFIEKVAFYMGLCYCAFTIEEGAFFKMEYITTKEAAIKWNISTSRITLLANEGRIPGAYRLGKSWLIPASATKPEPRKANHTGLDINEADDFSFPLYHFRPDWSYIKENVLSEQQQRLLMAETAVLECRFSDAYPILEELLKSSDDIVIEIGCLWNAGICCIGLNKPDDFTRFFLRLQMLLSEDFPHHNDLMVIYDSLNTYVETIDSATNSDSFNTDIHEHAIPLACLHNGYVLLAREAVNPGSADTTLMELNLRFLNNTSAVVAIEMMHCHLLGIYFLRQDMNEAEKHAKAVLKMAFENKYYYPLVMYYRFYAEVFSPILELYPVDFQDHCHSLISEYEKNNDAFFSFFNEYSLFAKLTKAEYSYAQGVFMGLTNVLIADRLGVSQQTVKRRLAGIYDKLGVNSKKELVEYMYKYM